MSLKKVVIDSELAKEVKAYLGAIEADVILQTRPMVGLPSDFKAYFEHALRNIRSREAAILWRISVLRGWTEYKSNNLLGPAKIVEASDVVEECFKMELDQISREYYLID